MSADAVAAARYARALFEASLKTGDTERVEEELRDLAAVWRPSGLLRYLESPRHSFDKKKQALDKLSRLFKSRLLTGFLFVLLRKSRLGVLEAVSRHFSALALDARGVLPADVALMHKPDDSFKRKLIAALERITKKKVSLAFRQDPQLVGGFVIRMKNDLIDASIQTRLATLKKQLLETRIN